MRKHDKHGHQIRRPVLTQVHCHQHLETGCCGLAGNFGFQVGHGEVSEACAERACCPGCGKPRRGQWSSPTDSASAPRSTNSTAAAAKPCTSPNCLPRRAASTTTIPNEPPPPARPRHPGRPAPPPRTARAAALAGTAAALAGAAAIAGGVAAAARWALIRVGAARGK
jgi:hypothetical protein